MDGVMVIEGLYEVCCDQCGRFFLTSVPKIARWCQLKCAYEAVRDSQVEPPVEPDEELTLP